MSYDVTIPKIDKLLVRDTECYPNVWTFGAIDVTNGLRYVFEVSHRINQIAEFRNAVSHWAFHGYTMVGFNSIGYDYPVEHAILTDMRIQTASDIFKVSKAIIDTDWNDRFKNRVPVWKHVIPQIDLFLVHHFDNVSKSTSLKMLEFVMRMESIEDLPFKPETILNDDEINILIEYQDHDIDATKEFCDKSAKALEFRKLLSDKLGKNFMNHNDTKIGKDFFSMELERAGIKLRDSSGNLRQTFREFIDLRDCVLPIVKFEHPEFQRILSEINSTRVYETKGSLKLTATINGFSYDFGLGGIHGSLSGKIKKSNDDYVILDADVASYYPNLSISNKFYPEHLSEEFCNIYSNVYHQRVELKKQGKEAEQQMMKLALNGVYGDSNSVYSPFYDPKFTMSITINGQLLLCMLVEQLLKIPNLSVISINTDGVCCNVPRKHQDQYYKVCEWWGKHTGLTLEYDRYKVMIVRDVNNFIGIQYEEGEEELNHNESTVFISKRST